MDLAELQHSSGLSASELARKLGVSDGHVADLKSGRRELTLPLAARLEEITGTTGLVAQIVAKKTGRSSSAAA